MKITTASFLTTLVLIGGLSLNSTAAEGKKNAAERFYGRITSIDVAAKTLSMHNKTRKTDATMAWTKDTEFLSNKKPIAASQLKVGDFLVVSYQDVNGTKEAQKVVLRANFGKKKAG